MWLVSVSKQLNEKKFPNLSCVLAIEVFRVANPWRFVWPSFRLVALSFRGSRYHFCCPSPSCMIRRYSNRRKDRRITCGLSILFAFCFACLVSRLRSLCWLPTKLLLVVANRVIRENRQVPARFRYLWISVGIFRYL